MNKKRWVLASIVVAVVVTVMEWVFHSVLLSGAYQATASIWRPYADMTRLTPYGWLATLFVSFVLVYIYHKGYEGKGSPIGEGLRFGLWIGLLTAVPMAVWSYVTIPMPFVLAFWWFVIAMVNMLVAGAFIGGIYRKTAA
jgi:hypothetical protein